MVQSHSIPKPIRGATVSSYQRFITLGIWTAYMINYGTVKVYTTSAQKGRIEEARMNMARLNGVDPHSPPIDSEIAEIQEKLEAEGASDDHPWYECFTGPGMMYRTILGMVLQAGQQLTVGANYFIYYGTTIFAATGLDNSYVTSIILGTVNVAATIFGLWIVENMGVCLFIYYFILTAHAGSVMIVFTCLLIAAFATTWGPLVYDIKLAVQFLISFFSTMTTDNIDYFYGLVFGECCFVLFFIVYFFMIETKDRSLEEIDTMYVLHLDPITSKKWTPESLHKKGLVDTRRLHMVPGGRSWSKAEQAQSGRGGVLVPETENTERIV
ncbi:hypothetical protein BU25DRAFT_480751 [Macroventuria anomochaeta]|uniref:Uncharacterized protein n=1 Tax=Macroventuria anomochaeta TaxID=301207 RepID=A0ACB6RJM5_9PLEO|nr:uncharacterized protein BU25DRAFT_480751 [Macroventuria anomochaeta]KAF2622206.1 hypothetical protein BU25DRAFT_480751 [Macroventuria anomochaeta]